MTTFAPTTITPRHTRTTYAVERWLDWGIVAGLLTVIGVVTGWGLNKYPALNGDEGIYTSQANAVVHGALAPYTYTYDHPFFGWVQISGLAHLFQAIHLGGQLSVVNTRYVMLLLALANVPLLYGIGRRLSMPRVFAAFTVALFALSPLTVDLTRQVYLDNIALTWTLFAFFLVLNPKRNQWLYAASAAAFVVAVLSKETVVLFLPALVYIMAQRTVKNLRVMAFAAAGAVFTAGILIYPLFAVLRNELLPGAGHVSLWSNGVMYQLASRSGSGALWQAGSARQQLWQGWLSYDHVLIYSGVVASVLVVVVRRYRPIALAVLLAMAPILKPQGYLPAMYIVAALPFMALCVGGLLSVCWTRLELAINTRKTRWGYVPIAASMMAFGVLLAGLTVVAGNSYARGDEPLTDTNAIEPAVQTEAWLANNVPSVTINGVKTKPATVLNDDAFAVDLARMGLSPWQAVSYYKYDLDPTARKKLPGGYHDIDYIVDTPQMRSDIKTNDLVLTAQALAHSHVIETFGTGDARIEIRQVNS